MCVCAPGKSNHAWHVEFRVDPRDGESESLSDDMQNVQLANRALSRKSQAPESEK